MKKLYISAFIALLSLASILNAKEPKAADKAKALKYASEWNNPLYRAVGRYTENPEDGMKILTEYIATGGSPDVQVEPSNQSLLHHAAYFGNEQAARFLLEHGAHPSIRDSDGLTPLMWAAMYWFGQANSPELLEDKKNTIRLLAHTKGVNINAQDNNGKTALSIAKTTNGAHGNNAIIELLKSLGANEAPPKVLGTIELVGLKNKPIFNDFWLHTTTSSEKGTALTALVANIQSMIRDHPKNRSILVSTLKEFFEEIKYTVPDFVRNRTTEIITELETAKKE